MVERSLTDAVVAVLEPHPQGTATYLKAAVFLERGAQITGLVLTLPDGTAVVADAGRHRVITPENWAKAMSRPNPDEDAPPPPAPAPPPKLSARERKSPPSREQFRVWTDGGCKHGRGGWGAVIDATGYPTKELSGSASATTNNRMEIQGLLSAVAYLEATCGTGPHSIHLQSDSQYLGWCLRNGAKWLRLGKKKKNLDLVRTLVDLTKRHSIRFEWVKGHGRNAGNNRADLLASRARDAKGPRSSSWTNSSTSPGTTPRPSTPDSSAAKWDQSRGLVAQPTLIEHDPEPTANAQ